MIVCVIINCAANNGSLVPLFIALFNCKVSFGYIVVPRLHYFCSKIDACLCVKWYLLKRGTT